jgi:hypothetical protein
METLGLLPGFCFPGVERRPREGTPHRATESTKLTATLCVASSSRGDS